MNFDDIFDDFFDDVSEEIDYEHYVIDEPVLQIDKRNRLQSLSVIPEEFYDVFPYEQFNAMQSVCFSTMFYSDVNSVIGAPTGTGKTVCAELAIVRIFNKMIESNTFSSRVLGSQKVIYLAPIKALCQERLDDWRKKFGSAGIRCTELTGDTEQIRFNELIKTDIIITTPEKWDSITRKWKEVKYLIGQVALIVIDEVHLLNDSRGATLEAVVSRMKMISNSDVMANTKASEMRFIALSATIPNIEDIAEWLKVPISGIHAFGEEYRPVKLDVTVLGYYSAKNDYLFDRNLNYKLHDVITKYSNGRPALVFCSSRKGTIAACQQLIKDLGQKLNFITPEDVTYLENESRKANNKVLADILKWGIAFHHAGLSLEDRKLVETNFLNRNLRVLISTSALAQGVNLPAHLVVIKSTQQYKTGAGFVEYSPITIMQMIGRAGRPQFDTSCHAVIMTHVDNERRYQLIFEGKQKVESQLHTKMIEHINAEVVLFTIDSDEAALTWIKSSYLFCRLKKNPSYYGFMKNMNQEDLEKRCIEMYYENLKKLEATELIEIHGNRISPNKLAGVMARYYLKFDTMKLFYEMPEIIDLGQLIDHISKVAEYDQILLRREEKKQLNELNKSLRFKQKGRIMTAPLKINCLIQGTLGQNKIEGYSLKQDVFTIFHAMPRILKCLCSFYLEKSHFTGLYLSLLFEKCITKKIWENSNLLLLQLDRVGTSNAQKLAENGVNSFDKIRMVSPNDIERITNRNPPFGAEVKQAALKIPIYRVEASEISTGKIEVVVSLQKPEHSNRSFHLIVGYDSCLIYYAVLKVKNSVTHSFTIPPKVLHSFYIRIIDLNIVGVDKSLTIEKSQRGEYVINYPMEEDSDDQFLLDEIANDFSVDLNSNYQQGFTSCKHRCKDKEKCKHKCCKVGVKIKKSGKRKAPLPKDKRPKKKHNTGITQTTFNQFSEYKYAPAPKPTAKKGPAPKPRTKRDVLKSKPKSLTTPQAAPKQKIYPTIIPPKTVQLNINQKEQPKPSQPIPVPPINHHTPKQPLLSLSSLKSTKHRHKSYLTLIDIDLNDIKHEE